MIGIEHYIVTLATDPHAILSGLSIAADFWTSVEIARRVKTKLANWVATIKKPDGGANASVVTSYPPEMLRRFCSEHVRRTYHPRAKLDSEWHVLTEEFFGGYVSPAHPTGSIEYLVVVTTERKAYSYRVTGSAKVLLHTLREGNVTSDLPIPDLLPSPDVVIPRPEDDPD